MKKRFLKLTVNSDMNFVQKAIEKTLNFIENCYQNLNEEDKTDLRLIYSEITLNAVIHGNKEDSEKEIHILVELNEDGLITSAIKDEGCGYDYNKLLTENSLAFAMGDFSYNEHGRGVLLVKALCDELNFNESGNEIVFSKKVALNNVQHNDC